MTDALILPEIADALDTLADIMVSDGMDELAGYNASFWRDAALVLRGDDPMVADKSEAKRQMDSKELIGKSVKTPSGRQGTIKGQVEDYIYEVELDTGELVTYHLHDLEVRSPPPKTIQASDQLVVGLHPSTWER